MTASTKIPRRFRRRKRRTRNYPRNRNRYPVVPRSVNGFRQECVVKKLRFAIKAGEAVEFTSTSGGLAVTQIYRANDLYDPNYSGSGAQPRTFDQYMALYRNFAVLGSKLTTIWGYGAGSATGNSICCSVILKDGITAMGSRADVVEHNRTKLLYLSAEKDQGKIVHKYSPKLTGISNIFQNPTLWGTSGVSPTEAWLYHLNCFSTNASTESIWASGYIDFTVVFFHSIQPGQS